MQATAYLGTLVQSLIYVEVVDSKGNALVQLVPCLPFLFVSGINASSCSTIILLRILYDVLKRMAALLIRTHDYVA